MAGADGGLREARHEHRIEGQPFGAVVGQYRRPAGAEIQGRAAPLGVGLGLLVGHDALGAEEIREQADLRKGREEDGHAFVAEQPFAEDLHQPTALIGLVGREIEERGLTFGLKRRDVETESRAFVLVDDEFAGQVDDIRTGPVGGAEVFLAAAGAERPKQFAGFRLMIERLFEIVSDRHVTRGQTEDRETILIEVLAFVHQHGVERRGDGAGLQVSEELLTDAGEVRMSLGACRGRSDQLDVTKTAPVVEGQHLFGRQLKFVRRRADEVAEHVRVDQSRDTFRATRGQA